MKRRAFLSMTAAAGAFALAPSAFAVLTQRVTRTSGYGNVLILVELKGGNDGLNTVVPFTDPAYAALRPNIAIRREQVLQLDDRTGFHPAMQPLMPMWNDRQLAIVQGVSYPQPNLSHFRATQIWDTGSRSDQYLHDGWLARAFRARPVPTEFAADAVVIGSAEMGPLASGALALVNPAEFENQPWFTTAVAPKEIAPVLDAQTDVGRAAGRLRRPYSQLALKTQFPDGAFGASIKTAMHLLAATDTPADAPQAGQGVMVIRLTFNGFDTHQNQPRQQAALLAQLSEGFVAMRAALTELGRWNETLVMTYAEFGRRPRENQNNGTDHGTVAPHFLMGGRVNGGLHGVAPELARLDGNGNLPLGVDFRQLYATVLGPWWGMDCAAILGQSFETLPLLRV
jgi:uncharacterized protein (DUF1501 family)